MFLFFLNIILDIKILNIFFAGTFILGIADFVPISMIPVVDVSSHLLC